MNRLAATGRQTWRMVLFVSLVLGLVHANQGSRQALGRQDEDSNDSARTELRYRTLEARPNRTIFSPLDLPTPNRLRTAAGLPGEDYWQQQVDYRMEVELDEERESVTAKAIVTYTNNSPDELTFLWIALEQNLFRNNSQGTMFTPPGSRFNNRQAFDGGFDIQYVRSGELDLTLRVYDTMARIDLPQPLQPRGGQFQFEIAWSFNIPEYGIDRMGIRRAQQGKVFQLAQWFPQVCKYDDVHGWNTLPYLGQGEFYTDFGHYEVLITAPRNHVVCATGVLLNPDEVLTEQQHQRLALAANSRQTVTIRGLEEIGAESSIRAGEGPLTWHFAADRVRDFAWTSSAATVWDAAGIQWEDGSQVLVQSVYPREARTAWQESTQMLRHSILKYSDMWFQYPYPTATNVNGNVGGMEYPMIIFCGGDRDRRGLFGVTSHEIGHNWFPMMVNSDERRHAWMDEGFNSFINEYDRFEEYEHVVNGLALPSQWPPFSARAMARMLGRNHIQPIALPADQIRPEMLGSLQYTKPAVGLRMLREVILGPERFDTAFKHYIRAWAFKSPQPADFFRCMENGTGVDLAWFWRGWFLENIPLDQAVVDVREMNSSGLARIQLANLREMVMPVILHIEYTDGTDTRIELPVQIWNYTNLWTTEVQIDDKQISRVTIDPDRVMPDWDRDNNRWERPVADAPTETLQGNGRQ
ncbi:MAG TPA: M1 family metallopeptidase [Pirellulaceae bacterium]|nr:M1 family metallopeptidase [Pirellulaceae bacterium]